MSQIRLTLRPPPNVDFVQGYPGIPPGPDRPQATVKGALEVRIGSTPVKAKWIQLELRKIEVFPRQENTYYDVVGPGPTYLWKAADGEESSQLSSLDFPFSIRIPESIPPSLSLDNGAGIQYELWANVCTKGKKGIFRRSKDIVTSTKTPLIIDKHELHSTWPVYCQPEARQIKQEGVSLVVERTQTCFGPGDTIRIVATVKSDPTHTVILRGFEMCLKESMHFRSLKKTAPPPASIRIVCESKLAVNATLYGGTNHTSELSCQLSPGHTTTTLTAARQIDIMYALSVTALMGTGTHLVMDLPIVISNWQRNVSQEAVRRIGPAPGLSLIPPNNNSAVMSVEPIAPRANAAREPAQSAVAPSTFSGKTEPSKINGIDSALSKTYTGSSTTADNVSKLDDFGTRMNGSATAATSVNKADSKPWPDEKKLYKQAMEQAERTQNAATMARGNVNPTPAVSTPTPPPPAAAPANSGPWPDEKKLYKQAQEQVDRVQNAVTRPVQAKSATTTIATPNATTAQSSNPSPWPDEKKLYQQAREQTERTQQIAPPPVTNSPPPPAPSQNGGYLTAKQEKDLQRQRFNEAQSAVIRSQGPEYAPQGTSSSAALINAVPASVWEAPPPATQPPPPLQQQQQTPQYSTASIEKEYVKRYYEAKTAVDRNNSVAPPGPAPVNGLGGPVAYESLFPSSKSSSPPPSAAPPPFSSSTGGGGVKDARTALQEKMQMKRAYEAQDAAAALSNPSPPLYMAASPEPSPPLGGMRPTPAPPTGAKVLTAAEEKAMLKAQYAAEDRRATANATPPNPSPSPQPYLNGSSSPPVQNPPTRSATSSSFSSSSSTPSSPAPPPLMPKPPSSYIKETQEEDARVSKYAVNGVLPDDYYGRSSSKNAFS